MAEADGSARIRGTRGSGEHTTGFEFRTRRQFNRYSDTFRFVVVVVVAVAEGCRHARIYVCIYEAEASGKRGG